MRRIAEVIADVRASGAIRSVLAGDDHDAYLRRRMAAPDPVAFDADRLLANGWTADLEVAYQDNAQKLGLTIPDGNALVAALETAVERRLIEEERVREARAAAAMIVQKSPRPVPKLSSSAPADPTQDIVFDAAVPPLDLQDDDIHFGT